MKALYEVDKSKYVEPLLSALYSADFNASYISV